MKESKKAASLSACFLRPAKGGWLVTGRCANRLKNEGTEVCPFELFCEVTPKKFDFPSTNNFAKCD